MNEDELIIYLTGQWYANSIYRIELDKDSEKTLEFIEKDITEKVNETFEHYKFSLEAYKNSEMLTKESKYELMEKYSSLLDENIKLKEMLKNERTSNNN